MSGRRGPARCAHATWLTRRKGTACLHPCRSGRRGKGEGCPPCVEIWHCRWPAALRGQSCGRAGIGRGHRPMGETQIAAIGSCPDCGPLAAQRKRCRSLRSHFATLSPVCGRPIEWNGTSDVLFPVRSGRSTPEVSRSAKRCRLGRTVNTTRCLVSARKPLLPAPSICLLRLA